MHLAAGLLSLSEPSAWLIDTVASREHILLEQAAHDLHAQPAGDVVVRVVRCATAPPGAFPQRCDRTGRCQPAQLLEQRPDLRTGQLVVAMPAVGLNGQQPGLGELAGWLLAVARR